MVSACSSKDDEPIIIYVTATFSPNLAEQPGTENLTETPLPTPIVKPSIRVDLSPVPPAIASVPTPDPVRYSVGNGDTPQEHIVNAGDTLYGISVIYGISLDSILAANNLTDPNTLFVGQSIKLPNIPTQKTPGFKILPDNRLVRGPGSVMFNVAQFIAEQPGYIRIATDEVVTRMADGSTLSETLTSAQIVERVALEYSVDPRILMVLLEYRAGWLSNANIPTDLQEFPMISEEASGDIDRKGLYRQLTWAADRLNWGYYGWKYRGWTTLEFSDGFPRLLYDSGLNAATTGLQYFLSLNASYDSWLRDVVYEGFYSTYYAYFGDPFLGNLEPLISSDIQQPLMTLPFASGETWFYTGGWHGGWGSGSAWAAVDFAPPDELNQGTLCYVSQFKVLAVAAGLIVRSGGGAVVLDLDQDGDESTGWTVLYLHLATQDRITAGTHVQPGDLIGRASCEGGFSTATHLHIARRYNGEWIPADCAECNGQDARPSFTMSGWQVQGIANQEYQGYLENEGQIRIAEQGRSGSENLISW